MALVWGFVVEDKICQGLSVPHWPWGHTDSPTAEL